MIFWHLLHVVLSIFLENGKGDTERVEMEKVLLNILSDIQTPQLHHQVNSCHIGFHKWPVHGCIFVVLFVLFYVAKCNLGTVNLEPMRPTVSL